MKYLLFPIALVLLIASCSKEEQQMSLTGEIKGLKKGTLLLQKIEDSLLVPVDSVKIDGDAFFTFSEKIKSPEIYFLHLKLKDGTVRDDRIAFFAEAAGIHIRTTLKDFGNGAVVTGSANQSKLEEYNQLVQRFNDMYLLTIEQSLNAGMKQNDSLILKLEERQKKIIRNKYLATVNFALNNKDFEVAPYLLLSEISDAHVKYLDTVYTSLTPKIKDSNYGKQLESLISERKKAAY